MMKKKYYAVTVVPKDNKSDLLACIGNKIVRVFDCIDDRNLACGTDENSNIIDDVNALKLMRESVKSFYRDDSVTYKNLNNDDYLVDVYNNMIIYNTTYVFDDYGNLNIMFD